MSRSEVIKHSSAIQITNNVPFLARRMWNVLLASAYDDLLQQEVHVIPIDELVHELGISTRNREHVKDLLRALTTTAIEWNVLGKDQKGRWGVATLLAQAEIEKGLCSFAFSPIMRKRLYNPRLYAKISLSMQNRFGSKHALALYELAVDYLDAARGEGETPFIDLDQLRRMLGLEDGAYQQFKTLNRDVLKRALKEINGKSDLQVTSIFRREKRKVVAVKFRIVPNHKKRAVLLGKPARLPKQRLLFPDIQLEQDAFEAWRDALPEEERKAVGERAVLVLSPEDRARIESGDISYTLQYQIEVNMRHIWKEVNAIDA